MKLLLIDDDTRITNSLYNLLHKSYLVQIASDASTAFRKMAENTFDLVLLDLNLPDKPGQMVCEEMRYRGINSPVLILSGVSDPTTKTMLLDSGANDFLTKPFNSSELMARIRVQLRQRQGSDTLRRICFDDLVIDTTKHLVTRAGRPIFLRKREYTLLECLALNAGNVVHQEVLSNYAWDDDSTVPNNIHVQISNLRRRVDRPYKSKLIQTVHGIGYKLEITRKLEQ